MHDRFRIFALILAAGAALLLWPAFAQSALRQGCPAVPTTPYFTIAYGTVQLGGAPAPAGTIVQAVSPRDEVVGCFEVSDTGYYGAVYIYGEDTSASPPIPGLRDGETVTFFVGSAQASASPTLVWHNDRTSHQADLSVSSPGPTDTPTPTPTSSVLPDLVVENMDAPAEVGLDESIVLTITVRNQSGAAVSRYFYTDLYIDHLPIGCGDPGWDYLRIDNLGASDSQALVFTHPGFTQAGTHSFYVQIDSACQVAEAAEENNVDGPLRVRVVEETPEPPPVAGFSASPRSGSAPLSVQFSDLSTGEVTARQWSFGDGGTSTQANPSYSYVTSGSYTITLAVTGPGGSDTLSRTHYITAYTPVEVGFTAWPTDGLAPLTVTFTHACSGDWSSLLWSFGDGATSAAHEPSHQYMVPGAYTVTLTASGPGGTDALVRPDYIHVYGPVRADFAGQPRSGIAPLLVHFTNLSSGWFETSLWEFGDGVTTTLPGPSHVYTATGTFPVRLTVSGPGGSDSREEVDYITVLQGHWVYLPLVLRTP